jgi:Uncharacterized conserved protein (some members contain a von Willebrand factor type A (vWA) domain)
VLTLARLRRWFRPPRRFRLTREGKWFIGATLVLGFAAINGGINLLFLIFGMLLCLLLANGVLSEASMRRLVVTRRLPAAIHAGTPFLVGIAVRNAKKRIPTFSLEVEDMVATKPVDRRCFYLKVPAGREQETAYRRTLPRRGIHRLSGLRLSTRFPFGLLRRSIDLDVPAELLVYPALVSVTDAVLSSGLAELNDRQSTTRTRRGEFESLREFRTGDDPRDIHWRTSARRGRRFVRQFEGNTGRLVVVALDDAQPKQPAPGADPAAPFEAAVSLAASAALVLLRQGYQVGLVTGSGFVAPGAGNTQASHILRSLALVEMRPAADEKPASIVLPAALRGVAILRVLQGPQAPRLEASRASARPS